LIEKQLAELVRIKFSEMKDTLTNPINEFYYKEIKKYLDSEVENKAKISDVSSFLKFDKETGLFN
jgi:CRISPR/Cas system CSM-associated protein Csm5 (group 7 of RAMP superfamily)